MERPTQKSLTRCKLLGTGAETYTNCTPAEFREPLSSAPRNEYLIMHQYTRYSVALLKTIADETSRWKITDAMLSVVVLLVLLAEHMSLGVL